MNNVNAQNAIDDARREFRKVTSLINRTRRATSPSRKFYTLYSLMKASGVIEYSIKTILADFHLGASPQAILFIDTNVRDSSKNPSLDNIYGLLKQFDRGWLSSFKMALNGRADATRLKDSLRSLYENRNSFAHGKPSTASFNDIMQYFEDSVRIVEVLDSVVV